MAQHENKKCPQCNNIFECKVGNVLECQCYQIQLSYEEKIYFESIYTDCLCIHCMHKLKQQYQLLKKKISLE
ncbi:MAG: cysteine-rich CWC family protein [Bacteroidetes bacterium]|nr:cysteine-rich CWC family protein [Bacteroidota bacterium]MBS1648478.1 cysteine-rich CWC family protein [Bacteroidota bacterium]